MLKITEGQIDSLKQKRMHEFCQQVENYLEKYYPKEFDILGEPEEQNLWVQEVVYRAQAYGFDTHEDLYSYVRAAITFDEDFHEEDWAQEIFKSNAMPSSKALLLGDAVRRILDEEIAATQKTKKELLDKKLIEYTEEKADYVLSFETFYGLGLPNRESACEWLKHVTKTAMEKGFQNSFLLDAYLEAAMIFGPDFHTQKWAQDIWALKEPPSQKCRKLLNKVSAELSKAIKP